MNLIAQIWTGPTNTLVEASSANLRQYAEQIGAEFMRSMGFAFQVGFSPQAQKLAMLYPRYDEFDDVCMLDCDVFSRTTESIFDQPGHGFHQQEAHRRVSRAFPALALSRAGFYGGPLYKFSRDERKALREQIDFAQLKAFDNAAGGWDEGMIHCLCDKAKIPASYLPETWAWSSYKPDLDKAKFIHVRSKPTGSKLENYKRLVAEGVIQ